MVCAHGQWEASWSKGVRKHWEALKDHWVLDYRAVPQVRSPGLWYGHSQAQCHTGQGCSGPQGPGNPSCGWDKGPAKSSRGLNWFPQLLTYLLCPQRTKSAGARCPRIKREPSMLFRLFMNKGGSEG